MGTKHDSGNSPLTRPGFIISSVVVALVVAAGVTIGVISSGREHAPVSSSAPTASGTSSQPADTGTAQAGGDSVCGLADGESGASYLDQAPQADRWDYQGSTAYPVSAQYGPGATDPAGFRYCFQHSPAGAVFAAVSAVAQPDGLDEQAAASWMRYFAAPGSARDELLAMAERSGTGTSQSRDVGGSTGARVRVAGFRLLAYDGSSARVDVAVGGSADGRTMLMSMVYELVWLDGDWRLVMRDAKAPMDVATIPDLVGYVPWGAS